MADDNFMPAARVAADTFVHMLNKGDQFAVFAFSDNVSNVYPANGALATYDRPEVLAACSDAIAKLRPLDMTNMKDALARAVGLLRSPAEEPRGIVLLSDGKPNVPADPNAVLTVLDDKIRTYAVGLGPGTDQALLDKIAVRTNAASYTAPTVRNLNSIYFDIIQKAKLGSVPTNKIDVLSSATRPALTTVQLSANLSHAALGVAWPEQFIPMGTQPSEIDISIYQPNMERYTGTPMYMRRGYAVYALEQPMAGAWTIRLRYGGAAEAQITSCGVDPDLKTVLRLEHDHVFAAGKPIVMHARLEHDGVVLATREREATADLPVRSVGEAISMYRPLLEQIALDEESRGAIDLDLARIAALHARKLAEGENILPRLVQRATVRVTGRGDHEIEVPAEKPGDYLIHVVLAGDHPNGGVAQRTAIGSVRVR